MKTILATVLTLLFLATSATAATLNFTLHFSDDPAGYAGLATGLPTEAAGDPTIGLSLTVDPTARWEDTAFMFGSDTITAPAVDNVASAATISFGTYTISPDRVSLVFDPFVEKIGMRFFFTGPALTDPVNGLLGGLESVLFVRWDTAGINPATGDLVSTTDWILSDGHAMQLSNFVGRGGTGTYFLDVPSVPLPGSLPLLAVGAVALTVLRKRR